MWIEILGGALMLLTICGTLIPFLKSEAWFVRVLDFPRLQLFFLGIMGLIIYSFSFPNILMEFLFIFAAIISIIYQGIKIFPYTTLHNTQVKKIDSSENNPDRSVRVVISNVQMKNTNFSRALQIWKQADPDLILLLETNHTWEQNIKELDKLYPFSIKYPLENTYGIMLFSRFRLMERKVNYLVEQNIPSIDSLIELKSGETFRFYGLHPKPPAPFKSKSSLPRDIELLQIASQAKHINQAVIVAGDLNDVAWSYTTDLFQDISGLLDPRIGRGMYSTYHAGIPFLRWPLDHLFHSSHFQILDIRLLESIGSDHFPILVHLNYLPEKKNEHSSTRASIGEKEDAHRKMRKAQSKEKGLFNRSKKRSV